MLTEEGSSRIFSLTNLRERERQRHRNKNEKIKKKKNIKESPKTTVIETKDEIKSKTKHQPQ